MALARYEGVAQDSAGNVIPNATVEVRRDQAGRPVVPLFSDRNGTVPMGNPITTNERGQFAFHVPGGVYYIRVFTGPSQAPFQEYTRRYQAVGTAAERDVEELASTLNAGLPIFANFETLELFMPPENANIGARVLNDPDPAKNGDYLFIVDEWKKQRGLPDTLGRMEVIGGTANAVEAEIVNGVDPGNVVMLFIEPAETNTGAVTINGKPLKNIDGSGLIVGQFLAGRSYFLTDEGAEYRLRQEGDVSGIPAGIAAAAAAGVATIDGAKEDAITEINPLVTTATNAASTATNKAAATVADRVQTGADVIASTAAKYGAELARDGAQASAGVFASTALGLAATTNGQQFHVPAASVLELIRYLNSAGSAVEVANARIPTSSALQGPNLLFDSFNEFSAINLNHGGWSWYGGSSRTFTSSSANIPVKTPVILGSGITASDKTWDFSQLGLKADDPVTLAFLIWTENAGALVRVFWRDAAEVQLGTASKPSLPSGLQIVYLDTVVPAGAVAKLVARVEHTVAGNWEIGGIFATKGTLRPAISRASPSKFYQETIGAGNNVLFDPFGERLSLRPREGLNAQSTATTSYTGTLVVGSANSPWAKNGVQNTGSTGADRIFDIQKMGLRSGDSVGLRALTNFSFSGGSILFSFRDASGAAVGTSVTVSAPGSGLQDLSSLGIIPSNAVSLLVRAAGTGTKELLAAAMCIGKQIPSFEMAAMPPAYAQVQFSQRNLWPDAQFRLYDAGITQIDGFGPAVTAGAAFPPYVATFASSPFQRKRALLLPQGAVTTDMNINVKRLGLKLGDVLTVKLGIYSTQTVTLAFFGRTAASAVVGSATNKSVIFPAGGSFQEISKTLTVDQTFLDTAVFLQVRLMNGGTVNANGVYVCARGIFVGDYDPILYDNEFNDDNAIIQAQTPSWGLQHLRNFHKFSAQRKLGFNVQLCALHFGDSWTHLPQRWIGHYAILEKGIYGSAGLGWIGLGYPSDAQFGFINGNVTGSWDDSAKTWTPALTFTKTGTWVAGYGAAQSPDLGSVASNDSTATFRINGFPAGVSAINLIAKTAAAVVGYSFDGGATYTNADLSVGTDATSVALSGIPSGTFNLWLKPISGTVELFGLDAKTSTPGIRIGKMGATGISAAQFAAQAVTATWRAALAAINPGLVTVMLGTNDQTGSTSSAVFAGYIQTIITSIRAACPKADILIMMPCENFRVNAVPMAAYSSAAREICIANRVAFHDTQEDYGFTLSDYASEFNPDNIHPDPAVDGGLKLVSAHHRVLEAAY